MKIRRTSILSASVIITLIITGGLRANIIINGDFELGYSGIDTDYIYIAAPPGTVHPQQTYTVHTDPSECHSGWTVSYGDHTSGTGNMMIVNAAIVPDQVVWQQTVTVTPSTDYEVSYWLSSVYPTAPANLQLSINDIVIGTDLAPGTAGVWQQAYYVWNSGASTTATVKLIDLTMAYSGDDFAIDDISMVPEPGTILLLGLGGLFLRKRK
jgi:hypothetical protein